MNSPLVNSLLPAPYCNSDQRDIALGSFMYEWSKLEMQLLYLFHVLTRTKWAIARIIFSTGIKSKPLSDIFKGIAQLCLDKTNQNKLSHLCESYVKKTTKRNRIVHGLWDIEPDYDNHSLPQWVRIYSPTEPEKEKLMSDKHNQKERIAYRFTLKQLETATSEIQSLSKEFNEFTNTIMNQLYFEGQS